MIPPLSRAVTTGPFLSTEAESEPPSDVDDTVLLSASMARFLVDLPSEDLSQVVVTEVVQMPGTPRIRVVPFRPFDRGDQPVSAAWTRHP